MNKDERSSPTGRTIAIGDIHGCAEALDGLLSLVRPTDADTIVTLGDYIDSGPDSRGVIEILLALGRRCILIPILGNHEEMLFAAQEGRSDLAYWLKFGGKKTIESYGGDGPASIPREHLDFLKGCRRFYETDSHIFVHANYHPNRPMTNQSNRTLLWEPINLNWVAQHYSRKTVVVGHTTQPDGQILDLGFLKCIDTGCGYGGCLTALETDRGRNWQVDETGRSVLP